MQREAGGPVGYEGPGWPRVDPGSVERGQPQMGAPAALLAPPSERHGGPVEIEGWRDSRGRPYTWITPVVLEEGDAVVCLYVSATLVLLTRVLTCGLCRFSSHAVAVAQARFAARWHG